MAELFLLDVFRSLVDNLEGLHADYMVVGGLALVAWTEPRATTDIDVVLAVPEEDAPAVGRHLAQRLGGISSMRSLRFADGSTIHRIVVEHDRGEAIVDLMLPVDAFLRSALARSRRVRLASLGQRETNVATAEDLLLMKLRAWRPKDRLDAAALLLVEGFDLEYVEKWVASLGLAERWREVQRA